ncbi:DUF167 family protein [Caulobacter sp. NIBR2454]|uniref:DUF167 family protein n=1 Tax=Caulobacter sp. NIBR2454 TaxID=3015996 RepID=UPI0022B67CE7|nr:DUF167 family protein [Caulobacter sp. NIBR2454]
MAARIAVRLTPRGGRDRIDGWDKDAEGRAFLKARVSAPPADGEANAALVILLAKTLGVPKSAITIVAGQTARLKQVEIEGLETDEALSRLAG